MFHLFSIVFLGLLIRSTYKQYRCVQAEIPDAFKFVPWLIRGAVVPAVVWMFFNAGIFRSLPPLIPHLVPAKAVGKFVSLSFFDIATAGFWHIGCWWCAVTFGWHLLLIYPQCDRRQFLAGAAICSLIAFPIIYFVVSLFGPYSMGFAVLVWLFFISRFTLSIADKRPEIRPEYGRALTRINMGRYKEAEVEIVEQLEKREDDYEGWMMLAKLYATRDQDLSAAEKVIGDLLLQKNLEPAQVVAALERLSGWHLKLADDPVAARASLEEICRRYPNSEHAETARNRLEAIPPTREEWLARKERINHKPGVQW